MNHWSWKYLEKPKRVCHRLIYRKLLGYDNAVLIAKEAKQAKNEIVLFPPWDICRLLGWTDQYEDDYYWVIDSPGATSWFF